MIKALKDIGVELISKKGRILPEEVASPCRFRIVDFYDQDYSHQTTIDGVQLCVEEKFGKIFQDPIMNFSVDNKKGRLSVVIGFGDERTTVRNFELLRDYLNKSQCSARVMIYFGKDQYNSYKSLITTNLVKPDNFLTDKEFELLLFQAFHKIEKDVTRVILFPSKSKGIFFGRIWISNEESGKRFIGNYADFRKYFEQYYKENLINIDLNLDTKTLKKNKRLKKVGNIIHHQLKSKGDKRQIT